MNTTPLLQVENLCVRHPVRGQYLEAVQDVSFEIPEAGIVALVGESGSGKTTLAQAILRLQPAASGQVKLNGENLLAMSGPQLREARRSIQAVFQDPFSSLSPRRTVLQTLTEPLLHFRVAGRRKCEQIAAEALQAVDMDESYLQRYPHELSGGQRQRVALARGLVTEPALIIADEPLSALDVPVQARIVELIRSLRKERKIAFLVVSHDLSVVRRLADHVAVMYMGRIVEYGPAQQVLAQAAHPYTQALLKAVPLPDPKQPPPRVLDGEPPSPLTPPSGCVFHKRCRDALQRCRQQEPPERSISGSESRPSQHRVKCHLWDD